MQNHSRINNPDAYVGVCRCGKRVGMVLASEFLSDEALFAVLKSWLSTGWTIVPKFRTEWHVNMERCVCDVMFAPIPPELYLPRLEKRDE